VRSILELPANTALLLPLNNRTDDDDRMLTTTAIDALIDVRGEARERQISSVADAMHNHNPNKPNTVQNNNCGCFMCRRKGTESSKIHFILSLGRACSMMNSMQGRCDGLQKSILLPRSILKVLVLSFLLFITNPFSPLEDEFISHYIADSLPSPDIAANITIYIPDGVHENDSIFRTNTLLRFGTGRFIYNFHELHPDCTRCEPSETNIDDYPPGPCLGVTRGILEKECYRCNYPSRCKRMIEGDEMCSRKDYDARQYYSADIPDNGYLPLGPRLDSWSALQLMQQSPEFIMKPPSSRRYAFNAIFSKGTGEGRRHLANHVLGMPAANLTMPIYTSVSRKWSSLTEVDTVDTGIANKLNPHSYMEVLLDSIFTLSPAGHNPECFRMFEAVEAGSIPVLVKEDLFVSASGACLEPLKHWRDAPILVLDSWDDLYPTVVRLLGDMAALDKVQRDLRSWYEGYMRKVVREFEDFMMKPVELNTSSASSTSM
jgi:hypothetical protein